MMNRPHVMTECFEGTARLADTEMVKTLFPDRFDGCRCHKAFPDQIHTFVGGAWLAKLGEMDTLNVSLINVTFAPCCWFSHVAVGTNPKRNSTVWLHPVANRPLGKSWTRASRRASDLLPDFPYPHLHDSAFSNPYESVYEKMDD